MHELNLWAHGELKQGTLCHVTVVVTGAIHQIFCSSHSGSMVGCNSWIPYIWVTSSGHMLLFKVTHATFWLECLSSFRDVFLFCHSYSAGDAGAGGADEDRSGGRDGDGVVENFRDVRRGEDDGGVVHGGMGSQCPALPGRASIVAQTARRGNPPKRGPCPGPTHRERSVGGLPEWRQAGHPRRASDIW